MSGTTLEDVAEPSRNGQGSPFEQRPQWHHSVPEAIAAAGAWDEGSEGWAIWRRYLSRGQKRRTLGRLLNADSAPLLWGLDASAHAQLAALLERLAAAKPEDDRDAQLDERAAAWQNDLQAGSASLDQALEALAWAYAAPRVAGALSPARWWALVGGLLTLARSGNGASERHDILAWQLLAGELPLVLAFVLPELEACRLVGPLGAQAIAAGLVEGCGPHGLPEFEHLAMLRPLLGCWTRAKAVARRVELEIGDEETGEAFDRALRQAVRLARPDGGQQLGPATTAQDESLEALFRAAGRLSGDKAAGRAVDELFAKRGKGRSAKLAGRRRGGGRLPPVSMHCPESRLALLRADWRAQSPRLAVGYGLDGRLDAELIVEGEVLFSGTCPCEVRLGGEVLVPGAWEEVCWFSDHEVDYLELEARLSDELRIQRQLTLGRTGGFLLWADAVLGEEPGPIEYRTSLPLAAGIGVQTDDETREVTLVGHKPRARVLPLALSEWRCEKRGGELEPSAEGLVLRQQSPQARSLFAPLFFDLERRRFKQPLTWRQLSVAETRVNQPRDLAAGYRVQIGKQQWLVYRSLTPPVGRTLLGHHLMTQFLVGDFHSDGTVHKIVEIE